MELLVEGHGKEEVSAGAEQVEECSCACVRPADMLKHLIAHDKIEGRRRLAEHAALLGMRVSTCDVALIDHRRLRAIIDAIDQLAAWRRRVRAS